MRPTDQAGRTMTLNQRLALMQLFSKAATIGKRITSYGTLRPDSNTDTMRYCFINLQTNASELISTLTEIATTASQNEKENTDELLPSNNVFSHEIVKLYRDKYSLILHMPIPLPRHTQGRSSTLRYPYRSELQRSLIQHRPSVPLRRMNVLDEVSLFAIIEYFRDAKKAKNRPASNVYN